MSREKTVEEYREIHMLESENRLKERLEIIEYVPENERSPQLKIEQEAIANVLRDKSNQDLNKDQKNTPDQKWAKQLSNFMFMDKDQLKTALITKAKWSSGKRSSLENAQCFALNYLLKFQYDKQLQAASKALIKSFEKSEKEQIKKLHTAFNSRFEKLSNKIDNVTTKDKDQLRIMALCKHFKTDINYQDVPIIGEAATYTMNKLTKNDFYDQYMLKSKGEIKERLHELGKIPEADRNQGLKIEIDGIQDVLKFEYDPELQYHAKELTRFFELYYERDSPEEILRKYQKIIKPFHIYIERLVKELNKGNQGGGDEMLPLSILALCKNLKTEFDYTILTTRIMEKLGTHKIENTSILNSTEENEELAKSVRLENNLIAEMEFTCKLLNSAVQHTSEIRPKSMVIEGSDQDSISKKKTPEDYHNEYMFKSQNDLIKTLEYMESVPEDKRTNDVVTEHDAVLSVLNFKYDRELKSHTKKLVKFFEEYDKDTSSDKTYKQVQKYFDPFIARLNILIQESSGPKSVDQYRPELILALCKQTDPTFDYGKAVKNIAANLDKHARNHPKVIQFKTFAPVIKEATIAIKMQHSCQGQKQDKVNHFKRIFQKIMKYLMKPHGIHFLKKEDRRPSRHRFFKPAQTPEKSGDIEMTKITNKKK